MPYCLFNHHILKVFPSDFPPCQHLSDYQDVTRVGKYTCERLGCLLLGTNIWRELDLALWLFQLYCFNTFLNMKADLLPCSLRQYPTYYMYTNVLPI